MLTPNTTSCPDCDAAMVYEPCSIGLLTVCPDCGYAFMEARNMLSGPSKQPEDNSKLYARAGIGPEYQRGMTDCAEVVQAAKAGRNVYIVGGNGTKKSTLAAAAGMALIDEGASVQFVNAAIAIEDIKESFDSGGGGLRAKMCGADILIIDDLGKGNPTEWSLSLWYSIVEARNAAKLPTIVTTNYDGSKLIQRLAVNGDDSTAKAVVSRLRGGALVVRMGGEDMRLEI